MYFWLGMKNWLIIKVEYTSHLQWNFLISFHLGEEDCKKTIKGLEYRGKISTTTSGRTCQRWDSQSPHSHSGYAEHLPGGASSHKNFCRNPKDSWEKRPWCYTTDQRKRWEYCDVPFCGKYCNNLFFLSFHSLSFWKSLLQILIIHRIKKIIYIIYTSYIWY